MNSLIFFLPRNLRAALLIILVALAGISRAVAQPVIVSVLPASGSIGVSPAGSVVFTFSEQMDITLTAAQFNDGMTFAALPVSSLWSGANKVLTCTPTSAFPSSRLILWSVNGENLPGDPLEGDTSGYFNTGGGGTSSGAGTNKLTAFSLGKVHFYNQTSSAAPTLDPDLPYNFNATTTLASNRSATGVTLTLPTSAVSNLTQNFIHSESFYLFETKTNLTTFNTTFPSGNYVFNVVAATSNQLVTVNFPASFAQPSAPHATNFAAAQAVNATQPFRLGWDAFTGGTAADYIYVSVGQVFATPSPGTAGASNGTATSVLIPAGTLQAGTNYDVTIGFYRATTTSNASYTTAVYLGTSTDFTLLTTGGASLGPLVFTNLTRAGGLTGFDVRSATGQSFTVEYSVTLLTNQWQTLLTTNSASGLLHLTHSATNKYLFYRARKNP